MDASGALCPVWAPTPAAVDLLNRSIRGCKIAATRSEVFSTNSQQELAFPARHALAPTWRLRASPQLCQPRWDTWQAASSRFRGLSLSPARRGWLQCLSRSLKREAFMAWLSVPRPWSGGEAAACMEEPGQAAPAPAERHRQSSGALSWRLLAGQRKQEAGGAIPARRTPRAFPGGPGSAKGSQCQQLAKKYGFTHLSTSDLLQNELLSLSERSKLIKDIVECGEPVPGGIVLELLKEAMVSKLGDTKGFLIDGYPQELKDAEEFESKIGEPKLVLCLDCSAETRSSQNSENTETTEDRTESYYQASNPLIAYYESKTQLCKVDAEGTQEDVFLEICKTIDSFLKKEEAAFFSPEMQ